MAKWNTTVRGGKITKRKMTNEERKQYGFPLSAKAQVEAETKVMNEERMMDFGWGSQEEDSMGTNSEPTPARMEC